MNALHAVTSARQPAVETPAPLPAWIGYGISALLIAAMALPFLIPYHRYPIPSFYQEWAAGVLALLASLLVAVACRRQSFVFPAAAWIPLVLLPSVLIHLAIGQYVVFQPYLLYLMWISLALLLMLVGNKLANLPLPASFADLVAGGLLLGSLVAAVIGLYLRMQGGSAYAWVVNIGIIGQHNHNGLYLWLGIIGASQLYLRQTYSRIALLVGVGILVEAAIASESRSIYLYAIGGLALGVWAAYRAPDKQSRLRLLTVGLAPIALLLIFIGWRWWLTSDVGALSRYSAANVSQDGRIGHWLSAWRIMIEHPLLGAGPGTFIRESWLISDTLPPGTPNVLPATHAHNLFFQLAAEIGSPTALAAHALLAYWLISALRANHLAQHWIFVAVPLTVLTHNQVEYSLWYIFFLVPTALCMGAAGTEHNAGSFRGPSIVFIAAVGLALSLSTGMDYRKLERVLRLPMNEVVNAEELVSETTHPLFGSYAISKLAAMLEISEAHIQIQSTYLQRALYTVPLSPVVPHRYAAVLAKFGRHSEADQEKRIAKRQFPGALPASENTAASGTKSGNAARIKPLGIKNQ